MEKNVMERLKECSFEDFMKFSHDLELLQQDIDMMNQLCKPEKVQTIKK